MQRTLPRLVPLAVILVLCVALYRGHDWARWALLAPVAFRAWRVVPLGATELAAAFLLVDRYLAQRQRLSVLR